jgi:hypothetical protein
MPLWATLKNGRRERVKFPGDNEEAELRNLIIRSGQPYSYGWIEVDAADGERNLVSYDAVERIELSRAEPGSQTTKR